MKYDISIVIPVLNESRYIEELLRQCNDQAEFNGTYRVVIVDNGSSDRTIEKIFRFKKKYPALCIQVHYERRKGIQYATKKGFEESLDSRFLVKLDADTRVTPHFLRDVWRELKHKSCDGIVGTFTFPWDIYAGWSAEQRKTYTSMVRKRKKLSLLMSKWFGPLFNGPFYALTSGSYVDSGGIHLKSTILRYNDDVEFGMRFVLTGHTIKQTNITVSISPRRLKERFADYLTGEIYWGKNKFKQSERKQSLPTRKEKRFVTEDGLARKMATVFASVCLRLAAYSLSYFSPVQLHRRLFNAMSVPYKKYGSLLRLSQTTTYQGLRKMIYCQVLSYLHHEIQ